MIRTRAEVLRVLCGRAAGLVALGLMAAAASAGPQAAVPIPGVRPAQLDMAGVTTLPTRIYMKTAEIDTTATPGASRDAMGSLRGAGAKHMIVQLDGPMTPERLRKIEASGIRLAEYLPENAYIATVRDAAALRAAQPADLAMVRFAMDFRPEWKMDPEIGRKQYATAFRQEQEARGVSSVLITLHQGEGVGDTIAAIAKIPGAQIHYLEEVAGNQTISATMNKADLAGLTQIEAVQYIEDAFENTQRSNYADRWILQSYVGTPTPLFPLYANGVTGTGQILGHCDGSINAAHCSFQDTVNPVGPSHRKVLNLNSTSGYDAHGTHTAATAVGFAPSQADSANVNGVATGAKLVHTSIPSQTEAGVTTMLNTQYSEGARVHTNSWGDDSTTAYTGQCRGVDAHTFANEDSLVCFAVSNLSTVRTPENAKNCFGVNRSTYTPNGESICGTTATGPTNDGRRKPEIMAPGCSIISATGSTAGTCGTTTMTGTSMACPAISGLALLVRQYYADGYYPTGAPVPANGFNPSAAMVKATIFNSAVDMSGVAGFPSNQEGWGRALADNALYFPGDARKMVAYDVRNANGLTTGQVTDYTISVTAGQSLKVAMVWSEPAAAANANPSYINDLDLEVIDPSNTVYKGNNFSGGVSVAGGASDTRNNAEIVLINSPSAGSWTVRVKATAVNQGASPGPKQGYALVVAGNVSNSPPPPPAPGAFNLASPINASTGVGLTPTLVWSPSSNVATYSVTVATDPGLSSVVFSDVGLVSTSDVVHSGVLNYSTTYYWGVTATNGTGSTASTPTAYAFTTAAPPCPPADIDGDHIVGTGDLTILLGHFGQSVTPNTNGDLDGDGTVGTADLTALLGVFGTTC